MVKEGEYDHEGIAVWFRFIVCWLIFNLWSLDLSNSLRSSSEAKTAILHGYANLPLLYYVRDLGCGIIRKILDYRREGGQWVTVALLTVSFIYA